MTEYIIDWDTSLVIDTFSKNNLREEIVRCRDCVKLNIVGECPCGFWAMEDLNGFCKWGERK